MKTDYTRRILLIFECCFVPLLAIELLFRLFSAQALQPIDILRSILFVASFSVLVTAILYFLHDTLAKLCLGSVIVFFSIYGLFQTGIKNYYGTYFSIQFTQKGMPNVGSYVSDYLKYLKPGYFLFLLIAIAMLVLLKIAVFPKSYPLKRIFPILVACFLGLHGLSIASLFIGESSTQFESSYSLYRKPVYSEQALYRLGLVRFLASDLSMLWQSSSTAATPPAEETPVPAQPSEKTRDDSAWLAAIQQESNESIKAIDQYLIKRAQHQDNEYTGILKGNNLIYVMVEAFDYIGIDETLTPTLSKIMKEGWFFNNHYSIQYNCATGESELISETGIYPVIGNCSFSAYGATNTFENTLYKLFKAQGYSTMAYHNWNDQFYARTSILTNMGADQYYDEKTLIPSYIKGWQSDLTMMQNLWPIQMKQTSPFMAQIITSSTHLPYDEASALGDRYLSLINQKFSQAPEEVKRYMSKLIEFDKAMEYLLKQLEEAGIAENTTIVLYGDHRPLKFDAQNLVAYTDEVDRSSGEKLDLTPMIIYTKGQAAKTMNQLSSNIDLLPTVANLFGLDYDSRLYFGKDVMVENSRVVWQSGSWLDEVGYYSTATSGFTPTSSSITYTTDQVKSINDSVKNQYYYSSEIFKQDYYSVRRFSH